MTKKGPDQMTILQKVYREIRKYMSREDARYAAPRIVLWQARTALRAKIMHDLA